MSDMAGKAAQVAVEDAGAAERQFKDSGTTFYSDYKKARRIVDSGSRRNQETRMLYTFEFTRAVRC